MVAPRATTQDRQARRPDGVAVVGAGYVGLTTAVVLAHDRNARVWLVESDPDRLASLRQGRPPIFERGVDALLASTLADDSLVVAEALADVLDDVRTVVVAVGTPSSADGTADLRALDEVVTTVRAGARPGTVLVVKSTVPPGTAVRLQRKLAGPPFPIPVVSCPEFLREGSALDDLARPARVVIGGADAEAVERTAALFAVPGVETVRTDATSAELIKYGSNAFLATKISFINEIANVCELVGGNVEDVARGMGLDPRIGSAFLQAGLGFGGSCFPKDVRALDALVGRCGYSFWMLKTAIEVNERQRTRFVQKICDAIGNPLEGRRVALLGLAFKPGTDDLRHAPSLDIATRLMELGVEVVAHDPAAMETARRLAPALELANDPYHGATGSDALALVTEWPEYLSLDWGRIHEAMRHPAVIDGRNALDGRHLASLGFNYYSIGRPPMVTHWARRALDRAVA